MKRLDDAEILELHRRMVATPSVSGSEAELAGWLEEWLAGRGVAPLRLGDTLLAVHGEGPVLLLDTHLDTVPAGSGWTADPHAACVEGGRIVGLGANDAKASAAAMIAAFLALAGRELPFALALALVEKEETTGEGTAKVLAELQRAGRALAGAVVGEPSGLDVATEQKGLLILELIARGQAVHAAHAAALGAPNAAFALARDLCALEGLELGPAHPELGPATLQPTVLRASAARNVTPAEAGAILDVRTTPETPHAALVERVRAAVAGEVRVVSTRLEPRRTPQDAPLLRAALAARPAARCYASPTMSDWALLPPEVPAIKCGPGRSERSHRPDEFVLPSELLDGARFYEHLVLELAALGG